MKPVPWRKRRVCAGASAAFAAAFGGPFAGAGSSSSPMPYSHRAKLGVGLALVLVSATPAYACGWWDCRDGYGYRKPARVYGYYSAGPAFRPMRAREVVGVPPASDNFGLRGPYRPAQASWQARCLLAARHCSDPTWPPLTATLRFPKDRDNHDDCCAPARAGSLRIESHQPHSARLDRSVNPALSQLCRASFAARYRSIDIGATPCPRSHALCTAHP